MSKEILKGIQEVSEAVGKYQEGNLETKADVEDLRAQIAELKRKGGRLSAGSAPVTFSSALKTALLEKKAQIQTLADHPKEGNSFGLEVKAVGDMVYGTNFASNDMSTGTLKPGIIMAPPRPLHLREIIPSGLMGGSHYNYVKEVSHDGDPTTVAEGAAKPQMDFNLSEVAAPAQVIAAYVVVSKQMLYDVDALHSFISNRLLERLLCIEDNQLLSGNGTSPNFLGINETGNFTTATGTETIPVEQLIDAISQLAALSRRPSGIILSPTDYFALLINKASTSGLYNLPNVVLQTPDGRLSIAGVPVVWTAEQAVGTFTVGDFENGTQLVMRWSPQVEFFVDSTLAKVNKTLIRIEERAAFAVFGSDYIIKGTLA